MPRLPIALVWAAATTLCAQDSTRLPAGWSGSPDGTVFVDGEVMHGGKPCFRIERTSASPAGFSSVTKSLPMDFSGKTVELRGFLRTEDVSDFFALWMREDGDMPSVAFASMQDRHLKGTTEWTEYSINLPIQQEGRRVFFGALVSGSGKAWVDQDLRLLVDGKPVSEAPKIERPKTVLDSDHQFDHGSGIAVPELTGAQIENLVTLGKVWGFLKYHHPQVTTGQRHWDYDLFRVLPGVLAARDRAAANAVILHWIEGLGSSDECRRCASLDESDLHLHSEVGWINDESLLGKELSQSLQSIYRNRHERGKQFYVVVSVGCQNSRQLRD